MTTIIPNEPIVQIDYATEHTEAGFPVQIKVKFLDQSEHVYTDEEDIKAIHARAYEQMKAHAENQSATD